ncbi:MAG TPA: DUF222 domain-containing protein [Solirubrobacterales bacterium]|nr:DUF222 domain-containing protein [Solirubrobacterales bacterium]
MAHSEAAQIASLYERRDAIDLDISRRLARFDAERGYLEDGCPDTASWLKIHCRRSTATALEAVSVARRLPELPKVEEAVTSGQIGFQHAAVIAESADKLGAASLLDHQEELVGRAAEVDPTRLRQEVKKVEIQVDAERMAKEAEWAYRSRCLKLQTWRDGRVKVDGLLDAEGGAIVKKALDAAMGPRSKSDSRSEDQRRADGFVDVARRALDGRKLGETGCQRPHVNVTVELETLAALRDEPGSMAHAGPALYETIERHLCDAALCFTVLHDGEVLLAGREQRTFSGPLRRALSLKKRHCEFPLCDRPAEWCEGHHLLPWILGGKTLPADGCLLCPFHHRLVHEGGWQVARDGDEIVAISPDGERHRSAKAPPAA